MNGIIVSKYSAYPSFFEKHLDEKFGNITISHCQHLSDVPPPFTCNFVIIMGDIQGVDKWVQEKSYLLARKSITIIVFSQTISDRLVSLVYADNLVLLPLKLDVQRSLDYVEKALLDSGKVSLSVELLKDENIVNLFLPSLDSLTNREKEIVKYIGLGLNNVDISTDMNVHVNTVKTHMSSILKKLGLRNRTEIAALLCRTGATCL